MNTTNHLSSRWLLGAALCMAALASGARATEPGAQAQCRMDAPAPARQSGLWAYVDPQTGKLSPPPAEAMGAAAEQAGVAPTSGEGLVAVPAPGGGTMVNLQGRFKMAVTARAKAGGGVVMDCQAAAGAGGH